MHRFPRVAPGKASCFWTRPRRRWRWSRTTARRSISAALSAEVRRYQFKAEKFASLGGDELAAMMAFIGAATRLVKTVEGVKENGAPPPELQPLRDVVASAVTHAEVAEKIRACVDDQGGFKDGASPELRRARSQRSAAEAKLRRALQSSSGSVTTHQGRFVLAVTPPAPAGAPWWASPPAEVWCSSSPRAWFY